MCQVLVCSNVMTVMSAGERLSVEGGVASSGSRSAELTFLEMYSSWQNVKNKNTTLTSTLNRFKQTPPQTSSVQCCDINT